MNKTILHGALTGCVAAACFAVTPAVADEIGDLKAEIAAQKQAAEAQKTRLDALEKRLNDVQVQATAVSSPPVRVGGNIDPVKDAGSYLPLPPLLAAGQGLTIQGANFNIGVYGLIDATIAYTNHADANGHSLSGFDATTNNAPWFSGARWGITGTRKLTDGGLNAIFKLENEYLVRDGSADDANAAFGRDAWVGFQSDDLGKFTFGRQNTVARDFSQNYGDPYGSSRTTLEEGGWTNSNNFKQLIFYAGSATGTRYNSSVVWKKEVGAGFTAGLGYQFGESAGSASNGGTQAVALAYAAGPLNLSGYYTHAKVGGRIDNSESIGGNYTAGIVRVNAGYFHYTGQQGALGNRSDNAYTVSVKLAPQGPMDYELGYQTLRAHDAARNGGGFTLNPFANTTSSTTAGSGNRSTLYTSAFYHFNRAVEIYLAGDYLKLTNGYTASGTHGFSNQFEVAAGTRLRF